MSVVPNPSPEQKRLDETKARMQRKLSRFPDELVVAVSRAYEGRSFKSHSPPEFYHIEKEVEVGTMTDKTIFGNETDRNKFWILMSGLANAFYLPPEQGQFRRRDPPEFYGVKCKGLLLLHDMDEPPEAPRIDREQYREPWEHNIYAPGPRIQPGKESRLELYIGDAMAVPYLRGLLNEGQFGNLSEMLGRKL